MPDRMNPVPTIVVIVIYAKIITITYHVTIM